MKKRIFAVGAVAICLVGGLVSAGCAQNDNGPSTVHDAATDLHKNAATPEQRNAVLNNPNVPARAKAFYLGQTGNKGSSLPPQIAARQGQQKK